MENRPEQNVTLMLQRVRDGDEAAAADLFGILYGELRGMAGGIFRSRRASHTLQPTALVHEAFVKIMRPEKGPTPFEDRTHFLSVAARAMRQILVNHARDRAAQKRGGGRDGNRVTLSDAASPGSDRQIDVLTVEEALTELAALDEEQARIAELKFFGGLTNQEVAAVIGRSLRTVESEWRMAKTWLASHLESSMGNG
jgi:RNA polymerase sigma factor (TIGR02999 family)